MSFFIRQSLRASASLWIAITIVFLALRLLPGDAVTVRMADGQMSSEQADAQRAALGLDSNLLTQYTTTLLDVFRGDLGTSFAYGLPVHQLVGSHLWPTVELALGALIVAVFAGLGLGVGAVSASPLLRGASEWILALSLATPVYWTGVVIVFLFATTLNWFPATGSGSLSHLVLPAVVLGYHAAGSIGQTTSASLREIRRSPFIDFARAKGLPERILRRRHILRVALPPIVTVIVLQSGFLLSGTVITEAIFARAGLGTLLLNASLQRDYPVVQAVVLMVALFYTLLMLVSDIIHATLDPRVRL